DRNVRNTIRRRGPRRCSAVQVSGLPDVAVTRAKAGTKKCIKGHVSNILIVRIDDRAGDVLVGNQAARPYWIQVGKCRRTCSRIDGVLVNQRSSAIAALAHYPRATRYLNDSTVILSAANGLVCIGRMNGDTLKLSGAKLQIIEVRP